MKLFFSIQANIFQQHLLRPSSAGPVVNSIVELIWPSIFLFFCLALLALIKVRAFGRVIRIVQSTFSRQVLQQLEREEMNAIKSHSLGLDLFYILNLTFLIYKINSLYPLVLDGRDAGLQFLFFLFLVTIVISGKTLLNRTLSFFTDERRLFSVYTLNSSLVNQTFGLFMFPWVVLAEFTDYNPRVFLWGALTVLSASILVKWYRGIIMGLVEERIGLLQIFSYFCGLEILPLFVLVKFVVETF